MVRLLVGLVLCASSFAVFVFGNPYYDIWPTNGSIPYYIGLLLVFGAGALVMRRSKSPIFQAGWIAAFALMMATAATLLLATGVLNLPRTSGMTPVEDLAIDKFSQLLHVVPILLGLALVARIRLRKVFVSVGRLRTGLLFGGISILVFAGVALLTQPDLGKMLAQLPSALPWMLVFILSNAVMEELWFRGIFLQSFERLIGRWGAILVTSAIFGAAHYNATYAFPGGPAVLAAVTFTLGVVGAWAMLRQKSLIGPILFHAGYDIIIIMSVLASS